nr:HD-GYP domain-containing protein [Lachnospira sp.]
GSSGYEEAAAQPEQPEVLEQMTYYEKIKQSQNFEHFNETFIDGINDLKTELNDIVINHETIDTTALLKNTEKILAEYTNTLQIFDMLHCMRDMDDLTYVHCINVAIIASILGKWLGYSEEDVKVLTLCGILHDIGKLLVPNEILSKPDRLTANEYAIIKEHVNLGYQIVKDADIDERVKSAILLHHEKCDGSGYPMGLKSEDIPDFAKIITIADIYDAMTSSRIYRKALCPFHVVRDMEQDAFTKFDPKFSLPFLKNVATSYIGNNVKLSDGRTGEVVLINEHALSRPIVKCEGNEFVDLSKERNLEIVAVLQ